MANRYTESFTVTDSQGEGRCIRSTRCAAYC